MQYALARLNIMCMTTATLSPQAQVKSNEGKGNGLQSIVTQNMRIAMAMRGVSQKDLAAAMGFNPSAISQKMTGRVLWNLEDIEKASGFFNVKPEALVAGHGFEPWTSGDTRGPRFKSMGLPSLSKLSLAA